VDTLQPSLTLGDELNRQAVDIERNAERIVVGEIG
jgi:hypothetical protein